MIVKNKEGRKMEAVFCGDFDCPEIDEVYYLDSEEDVTADDIEFILSEYDADIQEYLAGREHDWYVDET